MSPIKKTLMAAALIFVATSCRTPKNITYLQGLDDGKTETVAPARDICAEPGDRIAIRVFSKNPELAQQFNLSYSNGNNLSSPLTGTPSAAASRNNSNNNSSAYVVDSFGDIEFPVLGMLHIQGLNRQQIQQMIEKDLRDQSLLKDAIVKVEFLDHSISFLGGVGHPGRIIFDRDRLTLLEGIALAGDLSMQGMRTNVRVIRMVDGKEKAYEVDLTDPKSVYQSPVFYLQPNDLVYVEHNAMTKRSTTPMGNSALTPSFWMSLASFAMSTALFIVKW